jgi:hypothetical protein
MCRSKNLRAIVTCTASRREPKLKDPYKSTGILQSRLPGCVHMLTLILGLLQASRVAGKSSCRDGQCRSCTIHSRMPHHGQLHATKSQEETLETYYLWKLAVLNLEPARLLRSRRALSAMSLYKRNTVVCYLNKRYIHISRCDDMNAGGYNVDNRLGKMMTFVSVSICDSKSSSCQVYSKHMLYGVKSMAFTHSTVALS